MKTNRTTRYRRLAVATLLLGGASLTFARTDDLTIQDFTADASGTGIEWTSANPPSTVAWDSGVGNPVGSLLLTMVFGGKDNNSPPNSTDTPSTAYVCIAGGNPWYQPTKINFSTYTNIEFDLKWDTTSDITIAQFNDLSTWPVDLTNSAGETVMQSWAAAGYLSGSTAGFDIELCGGPGGQMGPAIASVNIPAAAATGWAHVVIPINPSQAQLDGANGIVFHKWINQSWGIANPAIARVWIDNVMLQGIHAPLPPPTVSLVPAHAGLNLFSGTSGGNDRENIRTTNALTANYSWIGRGSTPVSYSFTITNYPGPSTPDFMINSFLIPVPYDRTAGTNGTVGGENAPDWNEATCIFMDFEGYNDGSGDWRFRYKTNSPGSNGANNSYYADVQAELRDYAGVLGTWTLTFVNDTNVTMTSPRGVSTNFVLSPDKASWFADNSGAPLPMYYYIGCRGNGAGSGLAAVLSRASIQGSVDTLDDNFMADTNLDTTKWEVLAAYAPSIQLVPVTPSPVYWVDWTLPAVGFSLQSNPSLTGFWADSAATPLSYSGVLKALVTTSDLPGANAGYYRLIKRVASQLQVLLPGEVNAPNTLSGKTGTPDPEPVSNFFPVTVNAVDQNWNIITSVTDTVHLTTTDTSATPYLPADAALVNGTVTFSGFYFLTPGTWTVTASDVTTPTVTSGTSAGVVATP